MSEISDSIMPGVISIPHGWGHEREGPRIFQRIASSSPGVSVNDVTDELEIDELSGNAALNGVAVKVEAVIGSAIDNSTNNSTRAATTTESAPIIESDVCEEEDLIK